MIEEFDKYFDGKIRIELEDIEYSNLLNIIKFAQENDRCVVDKFLVEKIKNPKFIKRSPEKRFAVEKAREDRTKKVKEKIQNAINLLRMQNKEITAYAVAKEAGISFVTARKYLNMLNEIK